MLKKISRGANKNIEENIGKYGENMIQILDRMATEPPGKFLESRFKVSIEWPRNQLRKVFRASGEVAFLPSESIIAGSVTIRAQEGESFSCLPDR